MGVLYIEYLGTVPYICWRAQETEKIKIKIKIKINKTKRARQDPAKTGWRGVRLGGEAGIKLELDTSTLLSGEECTLPSVPWKGFSQTN